MDNLKLRERSAEVGDLVFCHTCGDSHGWILNQFGIIKEVTSYRDSGGPDLITLYRVWLFKVNHIELVKDLDFDRKNIELISRASGNNDDIPDISSKWKNTFADLMQSDKDVSEKPENRKMPFS